MNMDMDIDMDSKGYMGFTAYDEDGRPDSNLDMESSSEDPAYNELKYAMTRGKFVSRGKRPEDKFKGVIHQHGINAYRIDEAMEVSKLAFDMTDKTYLNEYQKIILQRAFMYGVNNIICDYPGRIDLIISKCLMNVEADPDDKEEVFIMKVLHDGMLTRGTKGSSRQVKSKHLYEHIANIIPFNEETETYDGKRMEELMDGINQVWCENIANYDYNDEYDYVCYNGVVYDNEPALSEHLGEIRKIPPHQEGFGNPGYTWKEWYHFYGPTGHNYLVQWIAHEFQNAQDPAPFPPNF